MATNFQRESAAAIVRHFRDHAFALCADDPGMGKTYIANEVIRQMALEKMNSAGKKQTLLYWPVSWGSISGGSIWRAGCRNWEANWVLWWEITRTGSLGNPIF